MSGASVRLDLVALPSAHRDTGPEVRRRQVERWRAMTEHDRAVVADQLSVDVAELAKAGIRFDYPEASAEEVREELARRRFGRVLADEMNASQRRR